MNLTEAMNTYNIALYTIKNKGFEIILELDNSEDEIVFWIAKKGDAIISAFTPLSLLALVAIYEQYGDKWNEVDTGDIYDKVLDSSIL